MPESLSPAEELAALRARVAELEAAAMNEARYNAVIEAVHEAIVTADARSLITDWNAGAEAMFGYTRAEALGQPLSLLMPARFHAAHHAGLARVTSGGERHVIGKTAELVGVRKDGREFPLELSLGTWEQAGQRYYSGILRDITERQRAEQSLREVESLYRRAITAANAVAYARRYTDETYTFMGEGILNITGYPAAEMTPALFDSILEETIVHSAPLPHEEAIARTRAGETPYWRADYRLRTRTGETRWVADTSLETLGPEGKPIGSIGIMLDITERKTAEEKLRQLSRAVEQSPASIVITDIAGTIQYVNPRFCLVTGYTVEEAVGQNPRILKTENTSRTTYVEMWQTILAGGEWHGEFLNRKKNGELYWEWATISPIKDDAGQVTHFLAVKEDITERKRAEQLLEKRAAELATVAKVSSLISSLSDPQHMLQSVVDLAKANFGLYHAHVYVLNTAGDTLVLTAGAGDVGRAMVAQGRRIPLAQERSLVARAGRTRQGVIVNDVRADPGFLPHPLLPETRAELAVPMIIADQLVGVFDVQSAEANHFTDEDVSIQTTLAAQVAVALQNARSFERLEDALLELNALTRRLTREGWQGYLTTSETAGFAFDLERVTPLNGGDAPEAAFTHTLTIQNEPIGRLALAEPTQNVDDMPEVVTAVAERLSAHIENLRLAEQTEKRAAELEAVAKVSATVSATLEAELLMSMVVDLAKERFKLYHAHIYLLDETAETLVLTAGAGQVGAQMVAEGRRIPLAWEQSLVAHAARRREAVIANDVRANPDFLPHPLLPETRAELAVPMVVGDRTLGVFDVQADRVNYFTPDDVRIQTTLAAQIAVALNNALLYSDQAATVTRLRELDHLKSSFLANMSHELRTPLNSILGFTEVILEELDGPLTEQMENDLRIVYKNGQHLLNLINDVLDMAKIESGKLTLNPERFDLTEVLEEVMTLTSSLARTKDIELKMEAESGTLDVEADRMRLRQVFINIVNNAIKFTERGFITLSAVREDNLIRASVHDTGLGIPADHLESIFHEFTQVDTTTTRKVGGTGLGLPISRHLVEMHGGRLWAESTGVAGEGSTFIVELPLNWPGLTAVEE